MASIFIWERIPSNDARLAIGINRNRSRMYILVWIILAFGVCALKATVLSSRVHVFPWRT